MSTRSVIKIIDAETNKEVLLYHHLDGYIEGVGFDILKEFYDIETRSMRGRCNVDVLINDFIKNDFVYIDDDSYEYTSVIPADIEYLYTLVYHNGLLKLTAQFVNNWEDEIKILHTYTQKDIINMYLKEVYKAEPINNEQVKLIHTIYNKDLDWTHDRYVELLTSMFGVDTCKDLNTLQADTLIKTLQSLAEVI